MFSKNIKYLRKSKHISQDELADKLGYKSFTTIQKWEDGTSTPTFKTLKKISELFNIDIDDLAKKNLENPDTSNKEGNKDFNNFMNKYNKLDNIDRLRTEAYVDGLLDSGKYKKDIESLNA